MIIHFAGKRDKLATKHIIISGTLWNGMAQLVLSGIGIVLSGVRMFLNLDDGMNGNDLWK